MNEKTTSKPWWRYASLAALLLAVLMVWRPWADQAAVISDEPGDSRQDSGLDADSEASESPKVALQEVPPAEVAELTALDQYKERTRYPSTTRRLNENTHDLLNPGARYEQRHVLPGDENNHDLEWEVLFTADRYFVRDTEPVLISLQLWNQGEAVLPSQVTVTVEALAPVDGSSRTRLSPQADGMARTVVFKPQQYWPDYVGPVRVSAEFSAEGLSAQHGALDFYFTSASRIPARFNGRFSDRLVQGNLLIDVGLNVETAGLYRIDGNLFDDAGRPFGWARFEGELDAGTATATLRYYGLLFHDAQAQGRFFLRNLTGYRLRPGDTPHREDIPELASDYQTTGHYSLRDFHAQINDSPRREKMIRMYEEAQRRGVKLTRPEYPGDG